MTNTGVTDTLTDDVTGTITVEDNTGGGRRDSFISITIIIDRYSIH